METPPSSGFRFHLRSLFLLITIVAIGLLLARLELLYAAMVYFLAVVVCLPVVLVVVGYCILSACTLYVLMKKSYRERQDASQAKSCAR